MHKKPNIILIMTDQQQARACAREGFPLDVTPNLDRMASEGVWFDKAYTAAPMCGPARVSTFTGRYMTATGIRGNAVSTARYKKDLLDVLRDNKYKTALIGKNHTHMTEDRFDFWYEHGHQGAFLDKGAAKADCTDKDIEFDTWLRELHHWIADKPTPFPLECQSPYRLVSAAEKWIDNLSDESPFFMHLSISEPHNPYQAPEPYFSLFRDKELPAIYGTKETYQERSFKWQFTGQMQRKARDDFDDKFDDYRYNYYSMCRLIDDQIARLEEVLERKNIAQDTIIFFVSDHGDFVGDYGLMRKGPELPESLCRIPFFVKGPGIKANPNANDAHVNLVDVMPTICEMIGAKIPEGVQGKSLVPLLKGESVPEEEFDTAFCETGYGALDYNWDDEVDFDKYISPDAITFNELNQYALGGSMRMIRYKDWKLISSTTGSSQLYNLIDDPQELNNLIDGQSQQSRKMRAILMEKMVMKLIQNEEPLSNVTETTEKYKDSLKKHLRNYTFTKENNSHVYTQ